MTLVANVLTSQFSDRIEQLERIVLIGSCVFLFLGYVAESKNSWAPGRKSIGSLQMICRVWGGRKVEDFGGGSQNIQGE